jgi:hypothetical protein
MRRIRVDGVVSNASLMSKILATTEYEPIKDDVSIVRAPPVSRRCAAPDVYRLFGIGTTLTRLDRATRCSAASCKARGSRRSCPPGE